MVFRLVIFDCDGVLVDSEPISNAVFVEMLAEIGIEITLQECIQTFVGRPAKTNIETIECRLGAPLPPDFVQRLRDKAYAAFEEQLQPVRGIKTVLAAISLPICVASSSEPELIRKNLTRTGLLKRFDNNNIFSAVHVAHGKPAPDLFLHAAQMMEVNPEHCAVIEDSVPGVQAGRAAGMTVFGYAGTFSAEALHREGAHLVFDEMETLPRLLNEYKSTN